MLPKVKTVVPKGWTGNMYKDAWHISLQVARITVEQQLERIHREQTNQLNKKLKLNQ